MPLFLAIYITIAGVLYAGNKNGVIKDSTTVDTYKFELHSNELCGDKIEADYLKSRLVSWGEIVE